MTNTPDNTKWTDFNTASKARDVLTRLINQILEKERPGPKHAQVQSVDWVTNRAMVVYQGDAEAVPVALTGFYPRIGQRVIVDGLPGDRHITDVMGNPLGIGDPIYDFTAQGVIDDSGFTGVSGRFYIPQVWSSYDVYLLWLEFSTSAPNGSVVFHSAPYGAMTPGTHVTGGFYTDTSVAVNSVAMEGTYQETKLHANLTDFGPQQFFVSRNNATDSWTGDVSVQAMIVRESA